MGLETTDPAQPYQVVQCECQSIVIVNSCPSLAAPCLLVPVLETDSRNTGELCPQFMSLASRPGAVCDQQAAQRIKWPGRCSLKERQPFSHKPHLPNTDEISYSQMPRKWAYWVQLKGSPRESRFLEWVVTLPHRFFFVGAAHTTPG